MHTVSLGQSLFFHFPPLLRDGQVTDARGSQTVLESPSKSPFAETVDVLSESEGGGLCSIYFCLICCFPVYKNNTHSRQELFWGENKIRYSPII